MLKSLTLQKSPPPSPESPSNTKKKNRIEPITIKITPNFSDLLQNIKTYITKSCIKKLFKGDKFYPESIAQYRAIQNFLKTKSRILFYAT